MIKLGTSFSGMETPYWALKQLSIHSKFKIKHCFGIECLAPCRRFIAQNIPGHGALHEDAETVSVKKLGTVDIYVAGFPCQSFSMAGKMLGAKDPRGKLFFHCEEHIRLHSPRAYILENVAALVRCKKFEATYKHITRALKELPYHVCVSVLNTADHGVPQNRERVFFCGIRNDCLCGDFKFPEPVECVPLKAFLSTHKADFKRTDLPFTKTHLRNLTKCVQEALDSDEINLQKDTLVIDLNTGKNMGSRWCINKLPCITKSRGQTRGYYLLNHKLGRMTTIDELLRLQGFTDRFNLDGISENQMGSMVVQSRKLAL